MTASNNANQEWEDKYIRKGDAHKWQNKTITADFVKALADNGKMYKVLKSSQKVLEVGCGTGDLSAWIAGEFGSDVTGIDISTRAIAIAKNEFHNCRFETKSYEAITDKYDLIVSSNTLEHFKNIHGVLRAWFDIAPLVMLIIPYKQVLGMIADQAEGGLKHVSAFDDDSFIGYKVIDRFTFKTDGWQIGENPRMLAVLIARG